MRTLGLLALLAACHSSPPAAAPAPAPTPPAPAAPVAAPVETIAADTPRTTVGGATFIAPAGWTLRVQGPATILEAPEAGSKIALIDVQAKDVEAALALAWPAYQRDKPRAVREATDVPAQDGWRDGKQVIYETSPNEKRVVVAVALNSDAGWTVGIFDLARAVAEKRGSQLNLITDRLLPRGKQRESFAGKPAQPLDAARVAALTEFVDKARAPLGLPGVAIGLIQDGKVVFAGGFGTRELGKPPAVNADTLFMIASNTKAMTTLLLAKLVDEGKLTWDTPVTQLMPAFKLGDDATTKSVLVKHLVCACTGLPRQDYEWLFNFDKLTPAGTLAGLANIQPTSKFGELFQYSNSLAAAAGYVAAHVVSPSRELGAAYDAAMQAKVFGPLGMTATTFDFARALRGNHAGAYGLDLAGKQVPALMGINYAAIPLRPAGAAWSNVRDMLKYVGMELAKGTLPGGKRFIAEEPLLARRIPQVAVSKDETYGMGLSVDRTWGVPVVHHGGDLVGYHSDMMWLPEQGVGAVILTNGEPGAFLASVFRRKLLETVFGGDALADKQLAAAAADQQSRLATMRGRITLPADAEVVGKLAARYHNDALGDLAVVHGKDGAVLDVGEWKAPFGTRRSPDGTVVLALTGPGVQGFELIVGTGSPRTLILRDGQHEYVFTEH